MSVTYQNLRKRGFRIHSTACSPMPHMVYRLDNKADTALEIGPYGDDERIWCVWLRSDIAHSRCRFCFIRSVETMDEIGRLILAIMDGTLPAEEEVCEATFAVSLSREREDCMRRYEEYCRNERWSYVPS